MAGLATIDDVGFDHVDLHDGRIPFGGSLLQAVDLLRSEVDQVIGDVFVYLGLGRGCGLDGVAEFQAQLGALVADFVVGLFQFLEVVVDFLAVGEFDRGLLVFIFLDFLFLTGLGGVARAGFEFVGEGVDLGAAVGEDALHG